jgi:hypothetical protein
MGQSFSVGTWKVLEVDGGDGGTAMGVPRATELCVDLGEDGRF